MIPRMRNGIEDLNTTIIMCAAINLSRGTSAIAVMIDNTRSLITTLSIICLHFVFRDFYFIFVMESEDKYKTSGGKSCAVNGCSNNRKKNILWKKSMSYSIQTSCTCNAIQGIYTASVN